MVIIFILKDLLQMNTKKSLRLSQQQLYTVEGGEATRPSRYFHTTIIRGGIEMKQNRCIDCCCSEGYIVAVSIFVSFDISGESSEKNLAFQRFSSIRFDNVEELDICQISERFFINFNKKVPKIMFSRCSKRILNSSVTTNDIPVFISSINQFKRALQ